MTGLPLGLFSGPAILSPTNAPQPVNAPAPVAGAEFRFREAMDRSTPQMAQAGPLAPLAGPFAVPAQAAPQMAPQMAPLPTPSPIQPAPAVPPASAAEAAAAARERARQGLDLGGKAGATLGSVTGGDAILGGLQRLRGMFDNQHDRIVSGITDKPLTAGELLGLQLEVANYSLMVEVTSKLTGKSTQALETLMKGQ